jgi:L-methionine (R)-S-oxide reductase
MNTLIAELDALLTGYWLTDLANFAAFFFHEVQDINWIGFYLNDGKKLRLGPFAGKPACVEIAFDRGVCGAAFSQRKMMVVDDVHSFKGHITCDAASNSELVFPLVINGKLVGVLDIDSPLKSRFGAAEVELFRSALATLSNKVTEIPF